MAQEPKKPVVRIPPSPSPKPSQSPRLPTFDQSINESHNPTRVNNGGFEKSGTVTVKNVAPPPDLTKKRGS